MKMRSTRLDLSLETVVDIHMSLRNNWTFQTALKTVYMESAEWGKTKVHLLVGAYVKTSILSFILIEGSSRSLPGIFLRISWNFNWFHNHPNKFRFHFARYHTRNRSLSCPFTYSSSLSETEDMKFPPSRSINRWIPADASNHCELNRSKFKIQITIST